MVLCSNCKKRPAVVFITSMHGSEKKNEGFCLVCAKKLNIPQVAEYMEHIGISDEDIEMMSDQMMDLMEDENFEMGGASTLPGFIQRLFTDRPVNEKASPAEKNTHNLLSGLCSGSPDAARRPQKSDADGVSIFWFGLHTAHAGCGNQRCIQCLVLSA